MTSHTKSLGVILTNERMIHIEHVTKEFKVLNRHEGLKGSIKDLFSRDYKTVKAVDDVSMNISKGEIVGYLGPNGAGKSTTIKMMTGILKPSAGSILVNGVEPYKNRTKNAKNIGVVFGQRTQLWWALPLIESFKILKDIYEVNNQSYKDMLELYDSLVEASALYHKPVREMSLGQRTLSDILAAFLHNPQVVFLDEPTIGLDVSMKSKIRDLVKELNKQKNTTVILTTHDMGDVDALCERTVIIDKGKMLYNADIENLRTLFGAYRTMKIRFTKDGAALTKNVLDKEVTWLQEYIDNRFPTSTIHVFVNEDWIDVLLNEEEQDVMSIMNAIQEKKPICDIQLQEISTESVIKKIYEGGVK